MHPHRFDQLFKRASRGSAAPGSQFVGHAGYSVLAASKSLEITTPRLHAGVGRGAYREKFLQAQDNGSVPGWMATGATSKSRSLWSRAPGLPAAARFTCFPKQAGVARTRIQHFWSWHKREGDLALCGCKSWASQFKCALTLPSAASNPSVKLSTNGMPPGPGWWYAVHFHQPGPGVMPLAPAYLER